MKDFLLLVLIANGVMMYGQSHVIELSELNVVGYVFEGTYETNFKLGIVEGRFTPTVEELRAGEELLRVFDARSRKSKRIQRRQYLGFKSEGSKYLLIHTLFFRCEKQFARDYPEWEKSFAYLLSDPDSKQKSHLYLVNLRDKTMGHY